MEQQFGLLDHTIVMLKVEMNNFYFFVFVFHLVPFDNASEFYYIQYFSIYLSLSRFKVISAF